MEQAIEKAESDIAGDYPVNMESRLLTLSKAKSQTAGNNPNTPGAMRDYLSDAMLRHEFPYTQDYSERTSQVRNRAEVPVMRLRLGTVFLAEADREDSGVQALLRTGSLRGKFLNGIPKCRLRWRAVCGMPCSRRARARRRCRFRWTCCRTRLLRNTTSGDKASTREESFRKWFHDGGIVMYPARAGGDTRSVTLSGTFSHAYYPRTHGEQVPQKKFYAAVDAKITMRRWISASPAVRAFRSCS